MQLQEIILFLAVAALASTLIAILVVPRWRGLRHRVPEEAAKPDPAGAHPARRGGVTARQPSEAAVPAARVTAPVVGTPAAPPIVHMICPTCRRQYASGLRYCPYDARVLTADLHQPGRPMPQAASVASSGKICPSCARRYDTVALVCGRDGTALVSVN